MSAAAIFAYQNRYLRVFREAGATTPVHAASLESLGLRRSWIFRRMAAAGVFVAAGNDKFYLDAEAGDEFLAGRRARALETVEVLVLLVAAAAAMAWVFRG